MAGDDLEGALTSQVQAGEDGQDGLGEEEEADSDGDVWMVFSPVVIFSLSSLLDSVWGPEVFVSGL